MVLSAACRWLVAIAAALAVQSMVSAATHEWPIDPVRSQVQFRVTKFGFEEVHGRFDHFVARIVYDLERPERSSIRWRVAVASVDTGEPRRDRTLLAPEYFDAARHPGLSFESTSVRALGNRRLQVSGTIAIRGVSRPLTIVARQMPDGAFETEFRLNRYDFGVVGGSMMGRLIGRTVHVHLVAMADGGTS